MTCLPVNPSWSREQTRLLLEEIKNHPQLYDPTHPLCQHRGQRFIALRMIYMKLKPIKPNVTPHLILKKFKALKCQYYKEKKMLESKLLLDLKPGDSPYQPKLWCYKLLTFIDKEGTDTKAKTISSVLPKVEDEEMQNVDDRIILVDESSQSNNDSFSPFEEVEIEGLDKQRQAENEDHNQAPSVLHTKCLNLVDTLTNEMRTIRDEKTSDNLGCKHQSPQTFLGRMVESELSAVCDEVYHDAKWKIIRILEEASKKDRDIKLRPVQIGLPSTSASTSLPKASYNLGRETRITVLDSAMLRTPIHTPICSQVQVKEVNGLKPKK